MFEAPPRRVLLVDDHEDTLEMYALGLRARGYVVELARTADTAFRLASDACPDVIVTDVRLAADCGVALAQRLRARPVTRDAPIVLLTGDPGTRTFAPADCYERLVLKPCTPAVLTEVVADVLAHGVRPALAVPTSKEA